MGSASGKMRAATEVTAATRGRMPTTAHVPTTTTTTTAAAAMTAAAAAMLCHSRRRRTQHHAEQSRQENVPTLDAHDFNSP
jgi:hypothetical protein